MYREMGSGFLEAVYRECLERELTSRGIRFESQEELALSYKGQDLNQTHRPDIICFDKIIVELKAVSALTDVHRAQAINYLRATCIRLCLLVNFCAYPKATVETLVL